MIFFVLELFMLMLVYVGIDVFKDMFDFVIFEDGDCVFIVSNDVQG